MVMKTKVLLGALALSSALTATACKKPDKEATKPPPTTTTTTTTTATADAAVVDEAAAQRQKVAERLAKLEADVAKEAARWTPELEAKVVALRDATYASTDEALTALLASDHRQPGNAARDAHRHPRETLGFFGLTPEMHVIELGAGGGWYTELLAPLLAKRGSLTVVGPDPEGPDDKMSIVYGRRLVKMLAKSPGLYGAVKRVVIAPPDRMTLGEPGSTDMVIAFREMHNWVGAKALDAYLKAIHAVLKDGGTFALIDHRAKPDATVEATVESGYLPEAWVIEQVTAAGFDLAAKSEINANPKDTKDYAKGVWTLPPALTLGDVDRDKYVAIGESDRMTLKFVKRAAGAAPAATK